MTGDHYQRTRQRQAARLVLAAALLCLFSACDRTARDQPTAAARPTAAAGDWFVDNARQSGLAFTHVNGSTGALYDAEIFAPGVALFDYDNDGDLDVYLVQGRPLGPGNSAPAPAAPQAGPGDRLYRNDMTAAADGTRTLRFTDVTAQSGIDVTSYGIGVATGDIDNDGWVDLYLTRLGPNVMLHNNGDGTFSDISRRSGTADPAWSVSAAFVDIDRDGWLDLYVGNYLSWSAATDMACSTVTGKPDYCPPAAYQPAGDRLYRNRGNGTFEDITARAGIGAVPAPALGVSTADFNGDGWIDIYVANDSVENFLWINQHDGTFVNTAVLAGVALDAAGDAEASMGVDAGDFDNDGDEDLFIANITSEGHTLYRNDGSGAFEDWGARSGLRPASLAFTGFGAAWFDADNDGWLDVLTANGAVRLLDGFPAKDGASSLLQRPQFFRNLGNGRFEDASARAGSVFQQPALGRGAAFGDVDNDGDVDVVVANNNSTVQLLINQGSRQNQWIGLDYRSSAGIRNPPGTRAVVVLRNGRTYSRRFRSDGSYASANDPRVIVGLGGDAAIASVRIVSPDGRAEEWSNVESGRWITLTAGTGTRPSSP